MTETSRRRLGSFVRLLLILDETKLPHLTVLVLGLMVAGTGGIFVWTPGAFTTHPAFQFIVATTGLKLWGVAFLALGSAVFAVAVKHYRETHALCGLTALFLFAYVGFRAVDITQGGVLGVWLFFGLGFLFAIHALGFRVAKLKGVLP